LLPVGAYGHIVIVPVVSLIGTLHNSSIFVLQQNTDVGDIGAFP
jgi:hypothetical protein